MKTNVCGSGELKVPRYIDIEAEAMIMDLNLAFSGGVVGWKFVGDINCLEYLYQSLFMILL